MPRKKITLRTADRLVIAGTEFRELARVLDLEGWETHSAGVHYVASRLTTLGWSLMTELEEQGIGR